MSEYANAVRLIDEAIERGSFPCACMEIGDRKGPIFRYHAGNRSVYPEAEPVHEDTLFDMASVTKILVTTMVALRLIEEGKISLSDTLECCFEAPKDKRQITILNLLTHTSGIRGYDPRVKESKSLEEVIGTILDSELMYPTGTEVRYTCLGFILLGRILETVGRDRLDKLATKYVFEPLELGSTTFEPRGENTASTDYDLQTGEVSKGVVNDRNARLMRQLGGVVGNAGAFSNLCDMSQFARMLANGGVHRGDHYLCRATFEGAVRNCTPELSDSRGLGFAVIDARTRRYGDLFSEGSYGHTGYTGTSVFVDRVTGLYVILLTNRLHSVRPTDDILRFRRVLHNAAMSEYLRTMK